VAAYILGPYWCLSAVLFGSSTEATAEQYNKLMRCLMMV